MYIGKLGDGSSPDDGIYILLKECLKHFGKNVPTFEFRPHK